MALRLLPLVNTTPRHLNLSNCCCVLPFTCRVHCLGFVETERHSTSIFLVRIFIPARSPTAESRSSACWRPGFFLRCFRDPIRVPRIRENYHRIPKIRENRVPRIREIGSLKIHIGYLTFSLKKICEDCWEDARSSKSFAKSKRLILQLPTVTPSSTPLWLSTNACGSQPRFWGPHSAPRHPLCGLQQSFNKTSNILCNRLHSAVKQNVSVELG